MRRRTLSLERMGTPSQAEPAPLLDIR
jgi:hypothetical protein